VEALGLWCSLANVLIDIHLPLLSALAVLNASAKS
jgi:hypothetical protein